MSAAGGIIYRLGPEEDLLRTLECPVCTDVPVPPIYGCENGHMICNECKVKLKNCALCKAKFLTTRNYPLESIVNASSFRCPNEGDGCPDRIKGSNYKEHIKSCNFRSVLCNHRKTRKCENQLIPMRLFSTHLTNDHGYRNTPITDSAVVFTVGLIHFEDNYVWPIEILSHEEGIFLQRCNIKGSNYNLMMKFVGPVSDAEKYRVKIKVFNPNKEIEVEWKIPVHCFRKADADIINEGLCVSIPKNQIMAIANEELKGNVSTLSWRVSSTIIKL